MSDAGSGNNYTSITQRRYLGSKTKLLEFIGDILKSENAIYNTFADIFAGTGAVVDYFHDKSNIIVNDILASNHQVYLAFFGKTRIRTHLLERKIKEYNSLNAKDLNDNYFSKNFSGTYFDKQNSKLIGAIRDDIEEMFNNSLITIRERAYLVTSLIYALDRIANTVGHYDAYRRIDIPVMKLKLKALKIQRTRFDVKIFNKDANDLVREIKADVTYIDPPYNSRQYSDAYHLLENIAVWDKQKVFGVAKKIDRSHIKSRYSLKSAGNAFSDLINNLDTKYILVSYNDMGDSGDARSQSRITDHEIMSALERRGRVTVYEKKFNQFTTGKSQKKDLKERIFFCAVDNSQMTKPSHTISTKNTHRSKYIKSPLNYTGGKHRLLPQLIPFFPENIDTFYDIFCGGANVGVNVHAKRVVCIEKNAPLVGVLNLIKKSNFEELHQQILSVIEEYKLSQSYIKGYEYYGHDSSKGLGQYNKESYLKLRHDYNKVPDKHTPLHLLVLIMYSFNNQIRFNSKGEFNLPVGKRDYNGSSRKNLANFNELSNILDITFNINDFREVKNHAFNQNDFIYLDPPYLLGLASYNESGGWTKKDEEDLYEALDNIHAHGAKFAMSNVVEHKGETNHSLLKWAKERNHSIHYLNFDYKNSNYQSKAKSNITKEVLVTNYA